MAKARRSWAASVCRAVQARSAVPDVRQAQVTSAPPSASMLDGAQGLGRLGSKPIS